MKNKELTKDKILDAFEKVLVEEGFQQLKIRHIASVAKVDKVLIYRYFGGMEGLASAYADSGEFWPDLEESLDGLTILDFKANPAESIEKLIRRHIRALRERDATAAILSWELIESSPACNILSEAREKHALSLYEFLAQTDCFESDFIKVFGAILGATVNYLIVRSKNESVFSGVFIQSEEGWREVEDLFVEMALLKIQNAY